MVRPCQLRPVATRRRPVQGDERLCGAPSSVEQGGGALVEDVVDERFGVGQCPAARSGSGCGRRRPGGGSHRRWMGIGKAWCALRLPFVGWPWVVGFVGFGCGGMWSVSRGARHASVTRLGGGRVFSACGKGYAAGDDVVGHATNSHSCSASSRSRPPRVHSRRTTSIGTIGALSPSRMPIAADRQPSSWCLVNDRVPQRCLSRSGSRMHPHRPIGGNRSAASRRLDPPAWKCLPGHLTPPPRPSRLDSRASHRRGPGLDPSARALGKVPSARA